MLRYNRFLLQFIFSLFASLSLPAFAHAGVFKSCVDWLMGNKPESSIQASSTKIENQKAYKAYLKKRAANPGLRPPTANYDSSRDPMELITGIQYWWFPGNIWHSLLVPGQEDAARTLVEDHQHAGVALPTEETLPTTSDSWDVPAALPSVDDSVTGSDSPSDSSNDTSPADSGSADTGSADSGTSDSGSSYDSSPSYDSGSSSFDSGSSSSSGDF